MLDAGYWMLVYWLRLLVVYVAVDGEIVGGAGSKAVPLVVMDVRCANSSLVYSYWEITSVPN